MVSKCTHNWSLQQMNIVFVFITFVFMAVALRLDLTATISRVSVAIQTLG